MLAEVNELVNILFIFSLLFVENIYYNFTVYLYWYDKLKNSTNPVGWKRNVPEIDIIL